MNVCPTLDYKHKKARMACAVVLTFSTVQPGSDSGKERLSQLVCQSNGIILDWCSFLFTQPSKAKLIANLHNVLIAGSQGKEALRQAFAFASCYKRSTFTVLLLVRKRQHLLKGCTFNFGSFSFFSFFSKTLE